MAAYLIVYGRDPSDRLAAYSFPDRRAAAAAHLAPSVPVDGYGRFDPTREPKPGVGGCSYIVEIEADFAPFQGKRLVDVYNGLAATTVTRFETRAIGIRRLMELLPRVAVSIAKTEETVVSSPGINPNKEAVVPRGQRNDGAPRAARGTLDIGEFKPVRHGSSLHNIMKAAHSGNKTVEQIAEEAGVGTDQASHRLRHVLAKKHGIGFSKHPDTGVIKLEFPPGKTMADAVKSAAAE
jgi:hypothetical protein